MSKEILIIFVYDVEYCKNEEDDPVSAILYFHPTWVSDQQRTSLCGQIMGTRHFLKSVFASPNILTLQCGKFVIREFGRYILAIGTDRNAVDDSILEYRADMLTSLIRFFHNNLDLIHKQSTSHTNFTDKLYTIFETYLKILQYNGNIFTNVPLLRLPKSGSNVFLEAIQILHHCQGIKMVLGGTILFHNKVLATQLSCNLTKYLVMSDPYRIKSAAEMPTVNYNIPLGVQLFHVYIGTDESKRLQQNNNDRTTLKKVQTTTKAMIKRDQSLIFTTVPEEDANLLVNQTKADRPKSLNLKSNIINDSNFSSKSFSNKAAVCCTPVAEKILHGAPLSVYSNIDDDDADKVEKSCSLKQCYATCNTKQVFDDINLIKKRDEENELHYNNKTITDPMFPVFNLDGKPISKYLYDSYLKNQYTLLNKQIISTNTQEQSSTFINDFDVKLKQPAPLTSHQSMAATTTSLKWSQERKRHSLSLPLKSLSISDQKEKRLSGVQLTPLIAKLSLLAAMEEHVSSGQVTTPTTPNNEELFLEQRNEMQQESSTTTNKEELQKVILFICSQQDTVLGLLLEEGAADNSELIQKLWEICTETLSRLEIKLRHCLDPHHTAATNSEQYGNSAYSYLCVDGQWDTTERGGPWNSSDLDSLTQLHRDFLQEKTITEITMRDEDGIIYGYRSGESQVYYHQTASTNTAGLPPPTDPMGIVSLKARRKLERDHAIILL